jgi:hypothetical protein
MDARCIYARIALEVLISPRWSISYHLSTIMDRKVVSVTEKKTDKDMEPIQTAFDD